MKKSSTPILILLATLLAVSLCLPGALFAQQDANSQSTPADGAIRVPLPKGKKLILKDGTFQLAREYSVEGDRVRYWSLERSAWEEIPSALVDWDATHKSEADQAAQDAQLKAKIRASDLALHTQGIDVDRSLEAKPGLFLPDGIGFYAIEGKLIFQMKQSLAESKLSAGREVERILTGMPIIPQKQTLSIPGTRAARRLTTAEPEFFMRPSDDREPRFRLLRAQVKGGRRILDNVSIYFSTEQVHKATDIEIQTWTPARGVFRYTVDRRLEPGEYAFVEMTDQGISGYVWDFGIDPAETKPNK
jgi:hypothetical protein